MLEKVIEIVAKGLGTDAAELTAETTFESLGADSLDLMDLVMSFEDEFGVDVELTTTSAPKLSGFTR